ncbi:MAG: MGMT family protein [Treponema sp.]|nr:MGMT family protein [Treponema sp.]
MPKKTWNEKLNFAGDLPKVVELTNPKLAQRYKAQTMIIAAPAEYDELMKKVPKGRLTTIDRMMAEMTKKYKAGCACPITAGIFTNIAAHASEERSAIPGPGSKKETPWWRTLKKDGQLSEKFPDGIEGQKIRLEAEGHTVIQKGKRFLVENYEKKLFQF